MAGKKIDERTKRNVIEAYENGISRKKIAEQFSISLSSVGRIVKEKVPKSVHEKKTELDLNVERQKRIEELERRIAELENKILEFEAKKKAKKAIF
ncbi:helix-turn-helix domain-containing protein [Thermodesulfobacteriota bacterium]